MKDIFNLQQVLIKHKNNNELIICCNNTTDEKTLSYKDLYSNALILLDYIQKSGIKKSDHLVFQISNLEKFVTTFWACILGGIIPVPISIARKDQEFKKVSSVWNCLNKPYLCIENQETLDGLKDYANNNQLNEFHDEIDFYNIKLQDFEIENNVNISDLKLEESIIDIKPDDIAFIQFSSGSTGTPKGVSLTHANLVANIKGIVGAVSMNSDDCQLSWLPLTHDMGLIGAHLASSLIGLKHVLITPDVFIRTPRIWMEKVNKHRATILHTPNYGLKVLISSISKKNLNWDLSCVRLIFTAAEPISLKLCDKFIETLVTYKLDRNAICPAYGLAEASVAVSITDPKEPVKAYYLDRNHVNIGEKIVEISPYSKDTMTVIEVGGTVENCDVCIRNYDNKELPEEIIGLIYIKGKNVTRGYVNNEQETKRILGKDGWLNTGDLGFIKNGKLVITGREKDIIFTNGVNIYPHDIENICDNFKFQGFKSRNLVVTSAYNKDHDEEQLLLFVRYKSDLENFVSLSKKLKKHIIDNVELGILAIIPIDEIPKTTSGKVCRHKLKNNYIDGGYTDTIQKLKSLSEKLSQNNKVLNFQQYIPDCSLEHSIHEHIEQSIYEVTACRANSRGSNLIDMGIDSLKAVRLRNVLQSALKIDLPVSVVFDYPTVNKLTEFLLPKLVNSYDNSKEE